MDWELYERYRATLVLIGTVFVSFLLLAFQQSSPVRHLKAFLVFSTLPVDRFLTHSTFPSGEEGEGDGRRLSPSVWPAMEGKGSRRERQVLEEENRRLHQVLDLKERRWPHALAAHVVGRDPLRWFQEIVLDKGKEDGVRIDDPVIAPLENQEGLVGRVVEAGPHVCKVMLVQDSLSAVAATIVGSAGEDGVVEGSNSHDLFLKFLSRGSQVKMGDQVVTSGLGESFPEGVSIGWVMDVEPDSRALFLQARLCPAISSNRLRVVLVLRR